MKRGKHQRESRREAKKRARWNKPIGQVTSVTMTDSGVLVTGVLSPNMIRQMRRGGAA